MSKMSVRKSGAHRDLNEADVIDLAAEGEDLGAFGTSECRLWRTQSAPTRMMYGI
jgi:hypothetical protein